MKKILYGLLIVICFMVIGCGKSEEKDALKEFSKIVEKTNGYHIIGELEIINNDDSYLYDVEVAYAKDENFRVSLKNKTNNHEQIILKNADGVYVITQKSLQLL